MIEDCEIAVWFSCGAASAVAAKKTIEIYGARNIIRVLNNPVLEEHEDNRRFLKDVQDWLGVKIEIVKSKSYPNQSAREVWEKVDYMSGPYGAPCTRELKKVARQEWEDANKVNWHVLGFTLDEIDRHNRFINTERGNLIPVLIREGITKRNCFTILKQAGIKIPLVYSLGYPNANCIGCVKAASPTYWNLVRKVNPDVFKDRAEQSRKIGAKLVVRKGVRIYLDELLETDKGRDIRNLSFECGIFCEEKW